MLQENTIDSGNMHHNYRLLLIKKITVKKDFKKITKHKTYAYKTENNMIFQISKIHVSL